MNRRRPSSYRSRTAIDPSTVAVRGSGRPAASRMAGATNVRKMVSADTG